MIAGVYAITNIQNGKQYVGSSKNIPRRKIRHFHDLRKAKHHSNYLQNSFNKYGRENFEFSILEQISEATQEILYIKEQYWIDKLLPQYNMGWVSGGFDFNNHPNGEKLLNDIRERFINWNKTIGREKGKLRTKENNPQWTGGKPACADCGKQISYKYKRCNQCSGKSKQSGISIDNIYFDTITDASNKLGIKESIIRCRMYNPNFPNFHDSSF